MASIPPVCEFGWPAVDASLRGVDGETHRLFAQAGPAGLVIAFICNHCPYVKAVVGRIVRDANDLRELGVGFVAINSNDAQAYPDDSFEKMKLFAQSNGFRFPYLHDEDQSVARAYGAACTPDFFGFNRARHAVLEAAILATRGHLLPAVEIQAELARLRPWVDKTGEPAEHRAFQFLSEYIQAKGVT